MMNTNCEILIPKTIGEVLAVLSSGNEGIKILAGGTDIVTGIKQGSKRFVDSKILIDINHISDIYGIYENGNYVTIGAATNLSEVCKSKLVANKLPLLQKACSTIGSLQIRNRATIAGNFINNAPCADTVPALLAYNTLIEIESLNSNREVSLQEFLQGPYKTQLKQDELVTRIKIPTVTENFRGDFYKLGRRQAVAISRLTIAVLLETKSNKISDIRIASGAVTPIGTRFLNLEEYAIGKELNEKLFMELARKMGEEVLSVTGLRWSSAYKLPVVQQMFYQLLKGIAH
jgi:xanthine dehydrogenase FAD-binding subunit